MGWPIREAVRPWKIIRGPIRKAIGNRDPMQRVNYQIPLYPPYENRKNERRARKRHQEISGEVGNLERMKMRDISKRSN